MIETNRVEFNFELENDGNNVGKDVGKDNVELSETQEKMLIEIDKNNRITQKELALLLKVSERTVQRNSKILQENGLIKRVGSDKSGHWEVIK